MADDALYGVTKVHGFVQTGYESLTSNFEFITIVTTVDIRTVAGGGSAASQATLDKLIEIVSERGQPVVMGLVAGTSTGTLILAIEHPSAWGCVQGVSGVQLIDRIAADGKGHGPLTASAVTFSATLGGPFA